MRGEGKVEVLVAFSPHFANTFSGGYTQLSFERRKMKSGKLIKVCRFFVTRKGLEPLTLRAEI